MRGLMCILTSLLLACSSTDTAPTGGEGTQRGEASPEAPRSRRDAARAWLASPEQSSALGLAQAYYPEFFQDERHAPPASEEVGGLDIPSQRHTKC